MDNYSRSIISILGYINIARVSLELFAGMCNAMLIYYFFLFSLFHVQQIGCYMGFCITACVIAFVMFICYCAALDEFATIIRCYNNQVYNSYNYGYYYTHYYNICSYSLNRRSASTAAGLGGCLLVCAVVETVIAFTASIYCCNAVCCGAATAPSSVSNTFMQ